MADNAQTDDRDTPASASPSKDDSAATETSGAGYGNNAYTDAGTGAPSGEETDETDDDGD